MSYLLASKAWNVRIAQRVPVKSTWTADDVAQALAASKVVDSAVYVLHASSTMSALILDTASRLGMIGKNYVWIASEGAAQANTSTLQHAEGLIITASYLPPSPRLAAFKQRWKQLSPEQFPGAAEEDPKTYSLAAYDAVYLISLALHSLLVKSVSQLPSASAFHLPSETAASGMSAIAAPAASAAAAAAPAESAAAAAAAPVAAAEASAAAAAAGGAQPLVLPVGAGQGGEGDGGSFHFCTTCIAAPLGLSSAKPFSTLPSKASLEESPLQRMAMCRQRQRRCSTCAMLQRSELASGPLPGSSRPRSSPPPRTRRNHSALSSLVGSQ
ncbi:hypothetical protein CLOP_g8876, partial [Closterium sp. NIES-67]